MVEIAKYSVIKKEGKFEVRKYPSLITASTKIDSSRDVSNPAFMKIASYIFGKNSKNENIAMTAPVITSRDKSNFNMSFVMPSGYNLKSLPMPLVDDVKLGKIGDRNIGTIRFSGFTGEDKVRMMEKKLMEWLKNKKIRTRGKPFLMRYNSPWAIPFLRRNEVGIELK